MNREDYEQHITGASDSLHPVLNTMRGTNYGDLKKLVETIPLEGGNLSRFARVIAAMETLQMEIKNLHKDQAKGRLAHDKMFPTVDSKDVPARFSRVLAPGYKEPRGPASERGDTLREEEVIGKAVKAANIKTLFQIADLLSSGGGNYRVPYDSY